MGKKLLTIGITSYNRVSELKRSLESIDTTRANDIEIIVSEDKSPKKSQIEKVVADYKSTSKFSVVFNTNEENLGYDRNLKKLIALSNSKYIFYLSDDDQILPGSLDRLLDALDKKDVGVVYSGFSLGSNNYRRYYKQSYDIPVGIDYAHKHLYDSILFSGLIFNVELVKDIDAERFLNKYYFQVYLYLYSLYKKGGYYHSDIQINAVGDGENGFGLSSSSEKNEYLANRKSVFSVLAFHKGLFETIKMFDSDYQQNVFASFSKEYNLRSIVGLSIARRSSVADLKEYWQRMKQNDIVITPISYIYYYMLLIMGASLTNIMLNIPRWLLKQFRNEY